MTIETGNPGGALIFFSLYTTVGVVVGGIVYCLFAYRGARRPQFRQWGTMPRTGVVFGMIIACGVTYMGWNQAYRGFYVMEIEDDAVRFEYRMPTSEKFIPLDTVVGFEEQLSFDKGGSRRLLVKTETGSLVSAQMYRSTFREVWEALAPYRK